MKAYEIVVESRLTRRKLVDMLKGYNYNEKEIDEFCKKVADTLGVYIITTLEGYFKLLADISDLTDNEFHIYSDGRRISMFDF